MLVKSANPKSMANNVSPAPASIRMPVTVMPAMPTRLAAMIRSPSLQCRERLVLGAGGDVSFNRQVREKRLDLWRPHLPWMLLLVEQDVPLAGAVIPS
jgi:hypothetical protein